jgi:hypothetical protein
VWDPELETFVLDESADVWWTEGEAPRVVEGRFLNIPVPDWVE